MAARIFKGYASLEVTRQREVATDLTFFKLVSLFIKYETLRQHPHVALKSAILVLGAMRSLNRFSKDLY
jgi:hypothetical protein